MNEIERGRYVRVGGKIKSALLVSPSETYLREHTLVDVQVVQDHHLYCVSSNASRTREGIPSGVKRLGQDQ